MDRVQIHSGVGEGEGLWMAVPRLERAGEPGGLVGPLKVWRREETCPFASWVWNRVQRVGGEAGRRLVRRWVKGAGWEVTVDVLIWACLSQPGNSAHLSCSCFWAQNLFLGQMVSSAPLMSRMQSYEVGRGDQHLLSTKRSPHLPRATHLIRGWTRTASESLWAATTEYHRWAGSWTTGI